MVHIFYIPVKVTREPDEGSIPGSSDEGSISGSTLECRECHYMNFY